MAVLTQKYKVQLARYDAAATNGRVRVKRSGPRPCMVVSVGMILAGMGMVFLMVLELLPVTLLLALAGFALTAAGGVMALIFCGEI